MQAPKIVGILNLSPESFSGEYVSDKGQALAHVRQMIQDGADSIDVGAQSTRPGSVELSAGEECRRIKGVVRAIKDEFPRIMVSIDTTKYEVASLAIEEGARMVNDISGGRFDDRLIPSLRGTKVKYVITHSQGTFEELHKPYRYRNLIEDINEYFIQQATYCDEVGLVPEQIITDPGIGFSKNKNQNITILNSLEDLAIGRMWRKIPMYVGISRKGFIGNLINEKDPVKRDNATTALHVLCIQKGVSYIRTHNVKNLTECVSVLTPFIK